MGEIIAGYELPQGKSVTDLEQWAPFVEWYRKEYGHEPKPKNYYARQRFEAWLAGAYWEAQRGSVTMSLPVESKT